MVLPINHVGKIVGTFEIIELLPRKPHDKDKIYKFKCTICASEVISKYWGKKNAPGCRGCTGIEIRKIHIGQKFGQWTVTGELTRVHKNNEAYFMCKCDCNLTETLVRANALLEGSSIRCKKCSTKSVWEKKDPKIRSKYIGEKIGTFEIIGTKEHRWARASKSYIFKCTICGYECVYKYSEKKKHLGCLGCRQKTYKDIIIGSKFSDWTVIGPLQSFHKATRGNYLPCECICGKKSIIRTNCLLKGNSKRCRSCSSSSWERIQSISKIPKLTEYNNPYLNYCITPRSMDDIIEHTGRSLNEVQDQLMDLQLEGKIEINREGLWETL